MLEGAPRPPVEPPLKVFKTFQVDLSSLGRDHSDAAGVEAGHGQDGLHDRERLLVSAPGFGPPSFSKKLSRPK